MLVCVCLYSFWLFNFHQLILRDGTSIISLAENMERVMGHCM